MHDLAVDDRQHRRQLRYPRHVDREVVVAQHREVRIPAGHERALAVFVRGKPRTAHRVAAQRLHPAEPVARRIKRGAAHAAARHHPVQRDERVVAAGARRAGARADRQPGREHRADRRRARGRCGAVARDERLALERHARLHGDAAAERGDARDVRIRNRLAPVEAPAQPVERYLAVHRLEHVQEAADRFVVRRMQPERPAMTHQQAHDGRQSGFDRRAQRCARLHEIAEIDRREQQPLARAVRAQERVAVAGRRQRDPLREIVEFAAGVPRAEVVRDAQRQLAALRERHDGRVVVRIREAVAAGVDRARHADTVQRTHEVPRRVDPVGRIERRRVRQRR
ncbi:hypothetical protein BLA24064_04242 [Burkholderia latens]|uniref:Uncharacterized protein n=1 Tax=Burkholderia latens TaxID=488446 RepID=A0A6P2MUN3_9BURK|nr:hypothetical protein BLA24064_04242 [Burkholderia latens]